MNLDDYLITCFVLIDELMPIATKGKRLRELRFNWIGWLLK